MGRRNVKRVTDQANNTQKAEIYALDAQGNVMAVYEINKEESEYVLSCKERMLYGSSRLGISKKRIIFENKSATDMSQMENSVYQFLNPSDAMANGVFTAEKKQKVWSGLKEYELSNHLGNVLATVSDRKLNKLSDVQNSQLQRYRPELRMSTEYYPFGSMLENWGCTSALECTQYSYLYADSLVTDHFTTGTVQDLIVEPYYGYDANNTTMSILSEANGNRYLQYNAAYIHQPILRSIPNLQHGKSYTLKIRGKVASGNAQITIRRYNKATPSNYGNATTKVINLNNNNWLGDSVVFAVDSAWRYVVHVRNSHNGASSIHIDDVRVYGMNTATYLACDTASGGYRYGFNGQEKDNDITGVEGAHNTAEFWMYDTRLGRRWNVDPVDQISISNYACFGNNPISIVDLNGLAPEDIIQIEKGTGKVNFINSPGDDVVQLVDKGNVISQYTYGEKGSFLLENKFIEEVFLDPETKEPVKANAIIFKDDNKAFDFFMLGAKSDKEFSYSSFENRKNNNSISIVGSSYSDKQEFIGPAVVKFLLRSNISVRLKEMWHSHPGTYDPQTSWPAYPSGFYPNGKHDHSSRYNDRVFYRDLKPYENRIPEHFFIILSNGTKVIKFNDQKYETN